MQTYIRRPFVFDSYWMRAGAIASGAVLFVVWLALVLGEVATLRFQSPAPVVYQGIALAVVFAGYAIGWRYELAGGLTAILGTVAFMLISYLTTDSYVSDAAALFAIPGVLYVLSWYSKQAGGASPTKQP